MRLLTATLILLSACGMQPPSEPPVRLVLGAHDTVVVNSRHPTALAVRAVDAAGRVTADTAIRYAWAGGDSLPVTPNGAVTCTKSGDLAVRAVLGRLATRFTVQCRVVEYVRIPGPLQFVLGDSSLSRPLTIPLAAYDTNGRLIAPVLASLGVRDTDIASLHGLTLFPRARGITNVGAHVGDREAGMGIHVYQRVSSLAALDTFLRVPAGQRLFAVPIQLNHGDLLRQHLPPGDWMLAMLPKGDVSPDRVQLRIEGARCREHFLNTPRRWGCAVGSGASVVLYRPFGTPQAHDATAYLLVRWLFS